MYLGCLHSRPSPLPLEYNLRGTPFATPSLFAQAGHALSAQVSVTRQVPASGTGFFTSTTTGTANTRGPELDSGFAGTADHDGGNDAVGNISINRSIRHGSRGSGVQLPGKQQHPKSNPALNLSFDGLNFCRQRYAGNGNQFSSNLPTRASASATATSLSPPTTSSASSAAPAAPPPEPFRSTSSTVIPPPSNAVPARKGPASPTRAAISIRTPGSSCIPPQPRSHPSHCRNSIASAVASCRRRSVALTGQALAL